VDLDVEGQARPLPAGVELAAYRIVQEALTNVRRHASASRAWVRLAYGDADLRIEVADDGVGSVDPHGGHGLAGMRERAELYGGRVETASAHGSGLVVRAYLPTEATT
jgi:signal transduction histidine kinase